MTQGRVGQENGAAGEASGSPVSVAVVLICAATVGALIALAAIGWSLQRTAREAVLAQYGRFQEQLVAHYATAIANNIHGCSHELETFSLAIATAPGDTSQVLAAPQRAGVADAGDAHCGELVLFAAATPGGAPSGPAPSPEGEELLRWAAHPQNAGRSTLRGPYPDSADSALSAPLRPSFLLAQPVYRKDRPGELFGVVAFRQVISEIIRSAEIETEGLNTANLWIVSAEGLLLWQTEHPEMTLRRVPEPAAAREAGCTNCHASFAYIARMLREGRGTLAYQLPDSPRKLVAFAPMEFAGSRWLIALNSPFDAIVNAQRRTAWQTLALVLAAVALLAGGLVLSYRINRQRLRAEERAEHWRKKQRLEHQLRQSEQRYRTMIEGAHDAIWVADANGVITFSNPRTEALIGIAQDEWLGSRILDAVHPADAQRVDESLALALAGTAQSYEMRLCGAQHEWLTLSVNSIPLREDATTTGTVSFARDTTAYRRAQAQIISDNQRRRALNKLLHIGLADLPLEAKLRGVLREILAVSGLAKDCGAVFLADEHGGDLRLAAHVNLPASLQTRCSRVPIGTCICGRAAEGRRVIFTSTVDDTHVTSYEGMVSHGHYAVPVISSDLLRGVLLLYVEEGHQREVDEEAFLRMAARSIAGIIERSRAVEALRLSEERYMLAAEGARDGLWDWDLQNNRAFFSERWKAMLGLADEDVGGHPDGWFALVHSDHIGELKAKIEAHIRGGTPSLECEYRIQHADGRYRWMLVRGLAVRDADDEATRLAGSQTDITERKYVEAQLQRHAFRDELTNLPNRALFLDRVGRCIQRCKRRSDSRFAVLMIDLDQFKVINDSLGHAAGDALLRNTGIRLVEVVRDVDTVARLGGDEFAILLDEVREIGEATRVAARINEELRLGNVIGPHEVFTTASVGIAMSAPGYTNPEELVRDADTAMHRAKAAGRARHATFDETMHADAIRTMQMENDLRRAIAREEFVLHYQPVVELAGGAIVGIEALVRWNHPERGMIAPGVFIPIAEETDLIVELGEWVLRRACSQCAQWRSNGTPDLRVAVNASPRQFARRDMHALVGSALEETGLAPEGLTIEVTESCIIGTGEANVETMRQLSAMGVRVALDDFGTGYSSLFTLKHLPIHDLKLDRAFIKGIAANEADRAITQAVVAMGRTLDLTITAEGIEDCEQLRVVTEIGCDRVQGFLLSRPQAVADVTTVLNAGPVELASLTAGT